MTALPRRHLALFALALATSWTALARAGSYLDTAALLLDESRRSADWVLSHWPDPHIIVAAHQLADARVKVARQLLVPKEAEKAHPHMLLSFEILERALNAAEEKEVKRFLRLLAQAREEERTFKAILAQQKINLPELEKCK